MKMFRDCPEGLTDVFSNLRIGIAGAGGIGSNVAMLLARVGAVSMVLADFDKVEIQNLNRQFFFKDQLDMPKVAALEQNLLRINESIDLTKNNIRITPDNVCEIFGECDVLIEAVDDSETKAFIIEEWSSLFPERLIVACSGIAGVAPLGEIVTKRTGKLSVVGDHHSQLHQGTFSARVMAVAASMVSEIQIFFSESKCSSCAGCTPGGVLLECDGRKIPLIGFPAEMLENTVRGMVGSLKGADASGSIKIELD